MLSLLQRAVIVFVLVCYSCCLYAENDPDALRIKGLPFFVSSQFLGFGLGGVVVVQNACQKNATLLGLSFYSDNDSYVYSFSASNYSIPSDLTKRFLYTLDMFGAHYTQGIFFVDGNPNYADERAGRNASSFENHVIAESNLKRYIFDTKYLLPIADGEQGYETAVKRATTAQGWNPLENGATYLSTALFYEELSLKWQDIEKPVETTQGASFILDWDNRNAMNNATKGGRTLVSFSYDHGRKRNPAYRIWRIQQSYMQLLYGTPYTLQQVLASQITVMDTPTWEHKDSQGRYKRPLFFAVHL